MRHCRNDIYQVEIRMLRRGGNIFARSGWSPDSLATSISGI